MELGGNELQLLCFIQSFLADKQDTSFGRTLECVIDVIG